MILLAAVLFQAVAVFSGDLERYASEVPISDIDKEVSGYVAEELNLGDPSFESHYTLAKFEDLVRGREWYILDGYYRLKMGRILFLDFVYSPANKSWWPIENYRDLVPGALNRYLLEADSLCDPHHRHLVGVVRLTIAPGQALDALAAGLARRFGKAPAMLVDGESVILIDGSGAARPRFALGELPLIDSLKRDGLVSSGELIQSERAKPDDEHRQAYVSVGDGCNAAISRRSTSRPSLRL